MFPPLDIATLRGATKLLIMQGTPFCNIDCSYCYLPHRDQRHRMSTGIISAAVDWVYANRLAADRLSLVWHAGEPLVLSPTWYREAIATAQTALPPGATIQHCIQTNAILINEAWCDLFAETGMQVGVSLDGPADLHDARRRTRAGAGTHAAARRGLAALCRRGLRPHAICVITAAALTRAEELIDFFADEGIVELGLNVEEIEGANLSSTLKSAGVELRFRAFFERAFDQAARRGVILREARDMLGLIPRRPSSLWPGNDQNTPFSDVTIGWDGAIHTFSPELAGFDHPKLGSMALGNVCSNNLADILDSERFQRLWAEVASGVAACARDCAYFSLCGGGEPSNKLAELGTCAGSETLNCRLIRKQVAETILGRLLTDPVTEGGIHGSGFDNTKGW